MKSLPLNDDLKSLSRRVVWFEEPEQAMQDTARFLAYAMTYGLHEDMKLLRSYLSDDDLREVLDHMVPGIMDGRSWAYWNLVLDRDPGYAAAAAEI